MLRGDLNERPVLITTRPVSRFFETCPGGVSLDFLVEPEAQIGGLAHAEFRRSGMGWTNFSRLVRLCAPRWLATKVKVVLRTSRSTSQPSGACVTG
jgi:hypothetical protein